MAGWEESPGVQKEIEWALTNGKTVFKLELEDGFFDEETTASAEFHREILGRA